MTWNNRAPFCCTIFISTKRITALSSLIALLYIRCLRVLMRCRDSGMRPTLEAFRTARKKNNKSCVFFFTRKEITTIKRLITRLNPAMMTMHPKQLYFHEKKGGLLILRISVCVLSLDWALVKYRAVCPFLVPDDSDKASFWISSLVWNAFFFSFSCARWKTAALGPLSLS